MFTFQSVCCVCSQTISFLCGKSLSLPLFSCSQLELAINLDMSINGRSSTSYNAESAVFALNGEIIRGQTCFQFFFAHLVLFAQVFLRLLRFVCLLEKRQNSNH